MLPLLHLVYRTIELMDQAETGYNWGKNGRRGTKTGTFCLRSTIKYIPTQVLPQVMEISEYGSFSGYKVNVNKTQAVTLNYELPIEIKDSYTVHGNGTQTVLNT